MFNVITKSIQWGGVQLELETGKIARQADGSVVVRHGNSVVMANVTFAKTPKSGVDFFPLTCTYQEKTYASGRIPGSFFRRESRPSERETLISRLIDRPIRPLFTSGFYNETQVVVTVLQYDRETDTDIAALVAASAALVISGAPFHGPISAARVGYIDGKYVLNPSIPDQAVSDLDLVVAGTKTSIMMVESEAKELSEDIFLGALDFAHKEMQPVITLIEEFAKEAGKPKFTFEKPDVSALEKKVHDIAATGLRDAYKEKDKQNRVKALEAVREATTAAILEAAPETDSNLIKSLLKHAEQDVVRGDIVREKKRIDGRGPTNIRPIVAEVGTLPLTHGSALFTRGETQALVVATLGTGQDELLVDNLGGNEYEHFLLHYNFPPYSVGEVGRMGAPGRREIGHGKLAWRAIHPLMPSKDEFPYTIRVVSEITESNGSSSMATVCGTSLALMDAGVPLPRPCAGIAMGLILEGKDFVVLSDILGDEDHLGDMDFKVAGTERGITSLQMDIKVQGITLEIMTVAVNQAHEGRKHILGEMAKAMTTSRGTVNDNAPKITAMKIHPDKIREVIGSGGKVIREICETSGAKVDIEDDGTIRVAAVSGESADIAIRMINDIVATAEVGAIYHDCKVIKIVDFGAFVQFLGKNQGLVHISEIVPRRLEKVEDVLKEGQLVKVKCIGVDKMGKVKLSMKAVDQTTGEDLGTDKAA